MARNWVIVRLISPKAHFEADWKLTGSDFFPNVIGVKSISRLAILPTSHVQRISWLVRSSGRNETTPDPRSTRQSAEARFSANNSAHWTSDQSFAN